MPVLLTRPPTTDDELWEVVRVLWGIQIPRLSICENHCSPFEAFSHAFFSRDPGYSVWYGSRGSGKSLQLALLALTKALVLDCDVTLLGGSMEQSVNVHRHIARLLSYPDAPVHAVVKNTATELVTTTGRSVRPLPASQKTVRGPHPAMSLLDEVDEMEEDIYNAAQGQPLSQIGASGPIKEYLVASSTWQHPQGLFSKILNDARKKDLPVFSWCYKENLQPHGWLDPDVIQRKKLTVPEEMFRVEFDLGEPSGGARAFASEKVEQYSVNFNTCRVNTALSDSEWVYEFPVSGARYCIGADWAKESDWTVIVVLRIDCFPRKVVCIRRMNRLPWPVMLNAFKDLKIQYEDAIACHDGTGIGNVVHDMLDLGHDVTKFVMAGRERVKMLTSYITAFESGHYLIPRNSPLYDQHLWCSTADIYSPGTWNSHLPDEVAAMALAHRALGHLPAPFDATTVTKDKTPRDRDKGFYDYSWFTQETSPVSLESSVEVRTSSADDWWSI